MSFEAIKAEFPTIINRVSIAVTDNDYRITIKSFNTKKKEKTFLMTDKKRVSQSSLMKIDTTTRDHIIMYYTYCMPEDLEKAKELLKAHAKSETQRWLNLFTKLSQSMKNEPTIIIRPNDLDDDDPLN